MKLVPWSLLLVLVVVSACVTLISASLHQTREEGVSPYGIQEAVQGNGIRRAILDSRDDGRIRWNISHKDVKGDIENFVVNETLDNGEVQEVVSNKGMIEKSVSEASAEGIVQTALNNVSDKVDLGVNNDILHMRGNRSHSAKEEDSDKKELNQDKFHVFEEDDSLQNSINVDSGNEYTYKGNAKLDSLERNTNKNIKKDIASDNPPRVIEVGVAQDQNVRKVLKEDSFNGYVSKVHAHKGTEAKRNYIPLKYDSVNGYVFKGHHKRKMNKPRKNGFQGKEGHGTKNKAMKNGFREEGEMASSRNDVLEVNTTKEKTGYGDSYDSYEKMYVRSARRECNMSKSVLACGRYVALDYLHRASSDPTKSVHIWGPISVVRIPPSAKSVKETKKAEQQPRATDSSLQQLFKFANRQLDRYTSTHAISWSLDAGFSNKNDEDFDDDTTGRAKRGNRKGIHGKRTAQIALPIIALILFKIKMTMMMLLMVLMCIKQFMMFASIMMPLMSKVNFFGKTATDPAMAAQPLAHQPDPGVYQGAGFQGYPYPPRQQQQPQYRTIIQENDYFGRGSDGGGSGEVGGGSSYDNGHRAALRPRP